MIKSTEEVLEEAAKEVEEAERAERSKKVNEPQHYKQGTFEVIDEMLLAFGPQRTYDFCILNAWKYRCRAPYKGSAKEDLQKADRYMQMAFAIAEQNLDAIHQVGLIRSGR